MTLAPGELALTILMPCLNEAETLAACVKKATAFLRDSGLAGEVLVADNGSTDGSQALAQSLGARVVDVPTRGYGAALYEGCLAARGRHVVMGDSDDSYDFSSLGPLVAKLAEGYDLVIGNRFAGGIMRGAMPWKNRWLGNPALSWAGRFLFGIPVRDFHCGLRGVSREAFLKMSLRTTGMEFASEMVIKASLLGMRIAEVPTTLHKDGRSRPPHLRPWRDGWRHLRFMLLYSPRWVFLYPGLLLMIAGTAVGAWLLPKPRMLGPVGLDVHTLLYAAMAVLIGFQGVAFSTFTRVFAAVEGLMPSGPRLNSLFKYVNLEVGLLSGGGLVLLGLAGAALSVSEWALGGFGALDVRQTLRIVIPSALALTLGCEVILASFFLSMLGLRLQLRREERSAARADHSIP